MRTWCVILLVSLLLAGCEPGGTPLTHALAAFRAGDHDALMTAKAEADEALKTAIQPGDDLCRANMTDVEKYGTVAVIAKLDQPELLRMSEDARLVYALKLAGRHLTVQPGSFLSQAPIFQIGTEQSGTPKCDKDTVLSALLGGSAQDANEARMDFLHGWMRDLRTRYGSDFDRHMQSAAAYLENMGYTARWPADVDFITD